eukprot:29351-Pelagococcus_subviridis.AAC.7
MSSQQRVLLPLPLRRDDAREHLIELVPNPGRSGLHRGAAAHVDDDVRELRELPSRRRARASVVGRSREAQARRDRNRGTGGEKRRTDGRERKSSRIEVHRADAVVRGPVIISRGAAPDVRLAPNTRHCDGLRRTSSSSSPGRVVVAESAKASCHFSSSASLPGSSGSYTIRRPSCARRKGEERRGDENRRGRKIRTTTTPTTIRYRRRPRYFLVVVARAPSRPPSRESTSDTSDPPSSPTGPRARCACRRVARTSARARPRWGRTRATASRRRRAGTSSSSRTLSGRRRRSSRRRSCGSVGRAGVAVAVAVARASSGGGRAWEGNTRRPRVSLLQSRSSAS